MNDKIEFFIDIEDYPKTKDFYETLRSFFTNTKNIRSYRKILIGKLDNKIDDVDSKVDDMLDSVSFSLSFQRDRIKITMSFD